MIHASAEFDLLRACAGVDLNAERVHRIANWDRGIDWDEFLRIADHHGVSALVAKNLLAHARDLPERVVRSLQSRYQTDIRRNLWFAGELARIARHFETRKLRTVPYKGPTLTESVYGDLALRAFSDLDFLIAPADFEPAKQALAELGYRPSTTFRPEVERLWLRFGYERAFDCTAGKYLVEVQWKLLPHFYAVKLDNKELLVRAASTCVGDREVKTLCAEDLLLVLCLHAAKHLWMRLIWIVDIAETMQTQDIDYKVLVSRARALGVLRILGVSFWLAQNLLQTNLMEAAKQIIVADPQVDALGREFADRLQRGATYDFESSEYFHLIMKLRERRVDQLRYLWRLVWTPGEGDVAAVRLPEVLFPLYRVVRLGRLVRKAI
jgi:hypothetical protein